MYWSLLLEEGPELTLKVALKAEYFCSFDSAQRVPLVYCGDGSQGTSNILYTSTFKGKAVVWHCERRYDHTACRTQRLDKGKRQSLPCKGLLKPAGICRKCGTKFRSASRDDTRPPS